MHTYRTHTCGALRLPDAGQTARLSGWVHRKRDHGQLLFIDLRDHYGITQCVIDISSPLFQVADALRLESVVTLTGRVAARSADTVNTNLDTGEVELVSRLSRKRSRCRSRSTSRPNTLRISASPTVSSICAASGCTETSCSDRTSLPRSGGA
jgi:aspartyl-tRNA synthetase